MHVCQLMLIEADTVEEAFDKVYEKLSGESQPEWSDWHNVDNPASLNYAGRWTGVVFATEGDVDTEKQNTDNYLQYSSDSALAEKIIDEYLLQRANDIKTFRDQCADLKTAPYDPLVEDWKQPNHMEVWYAKRLAQLLSNEWTCDSAIYDLENWTASLSYFITRVKLAPEKQWLIPIDFHF